VLRSCQVNYAAATGHYSTREGRILQSARLDTNASGLELLSTRHLDRRIELTRDGNLGAIATRCQRKPRPNKSGSACDQQLHSVLPAKRFFEKSPIPSAIAASRGRTIE
jgi:hypothetical protein